MPDPATRQPRPARGEDGFLTIQFALAVGLSLVLFTAFANVLIAQYVRGAAVAAADAAARAGAVTLTGVAADPIGTCEAMATSRFRGLVPGPAGDRSEVACDASDPDVMRARIRATVGAWVPLYPDLTFEVQGSATRERSP